MIVALDFDGTIVEHAYPEIGADLGAIPWLKQAQLLGVQFILCTMRDGQELKDARNYLRGKDIALLGLNHNPHQKWWTQSPKPYANLYIDDAALGAPLKATSGRAGMDWDVAGPTLVSLAKDWKATEDAAEAEDL